MPTQQRAPGSTRCHAADDFEVVPKRAPGSTATVSIALPSSILSNAQSPELRMYVAGQVARAAAIYCVDEVVIFREEEEKEEEGERDDRARRDVRRRRGGAVAADSTSFFRLILEYLETPQYLRKHLFPVSPELRFVGLLNPLALPSHVAKNDFCRWREGVAVGRGNYARKQDRRKGGAGDHVADEGPPTRYVDVGQERLVEIDVNVTVGDRVTVDMQPSGVDYEACPGKYLFGRLASRESPKAVDGTYWGYKVRVADCLSGVFRNSVVADKGYDLTVGTSERGTPMVNNQDALLTFHLPSFSNLLIVFGGVHGLERSVIGDKDLEALGISTSRKASEENSSKHGHTVGDLFDFYVNTCPNQGSRTIRTEEAVLLSLAALQPHLPSR